MYNRNAVRYPLSCTVSPSHIFTVTALRTPNLANLSAYQNQPSHWVVKSLGSLSEIPEFDTGRETGCVKTV